MCTLWFMVCVEPWQIVLCFCLLCPGTSFPSVSKRYFSLSVSTPSAFQNDKKPNKHSLMMPRTEMTLVSPCVHPQPCPEIDKEMHHGVRIGWGGRKSDWWGHTSPEHNRRRAMELEVEMERQTHSEGEECYAVCTSRTSSLPNAFLPTTQP